MREGESRPVTDLDIVSVRKERVQREEGDSVEVGPKGKWVVELERGYLLGGDSGVRV